MMMMMMRTTTMMMIVELRYVCVAEGGEAITVGKSSCGFLPTTWRRCQRQRTTMRHRLAACRRVQLT